MEDQAKSPNSNPTTEEYVLPFPNPEIESFVKMANYACTQEQETDVSCLQTMPENGNTTADTISTSQQFRYSYVSDIIYSTKTLLHSTEAAYKSQVSVCKSLNSALAVGIRQNNALKSRIEQVNGEIAVLNQQADLLRGSFPQTDNIHTQVNQEAQDNAKQLLTCLEESFEKHNLIRRLEKQISETNTNIVYLTEESDKAMNYCDELEALHKRTESEWQHITELFNINPDSVENDFSCSPAISEPPKQDEDPTEEEKERPSIGETIWSYVKIIIIAFLIALTLRAYVFDVTLVRGTSMYPTLQDGDMLINSKISLWLNEPERGDIVVLNAPDEPGEDYIKRIIGLPNEELLIENGKVYINGELFDEPYLNGIDTSGTINTVIPNGYYFLMGDNRPSSRDSRSENIGVISADDLIGKAVLRIYPLRSFGGLD